MNARIDWTCDACGQPISDKPGHIWIDVRDARRYKCDLEVWRQQRVEEAPAGSVNLASDDDLLAHPVRPLWKVEHDGCDQGNAPSAYSFGVESCRTLTQLLDVTAHLWGKDWAHDTAWDQLIRRALTTTSHD